LLEPVNRIAEPLLHNDQQKSLSRRLERNDSKITWCWRRGSNKKTTLKARKLLILRKARNAKSAVSAISWHVYGTQRPSDSKVGSEGSPRLLSLA
jgi:hypothetical protein